MVDRERKTRRAIVLESVFVEQVKVGSHQRLKRVLPRGFLEHDLSAAAEVLLVPPQNLVLEFLLRHAPVPAPLAPPRRHVRGREGHPERSDGHREPNLPRGHEELEADPRADGVAPNDVGHAVRDLVVQHGQQLRRQRVDGLVLPILEQLVPARVINSDDLDLLVLLGPVDQRRPRPREARLGAAGVVEAQDAQLRLVQRVP
mmetsp:Transcript_49946/g.152002  ORF Transcript_49946/g.152002 Transcript_49946/m.152002 type:complete len:202 (+) Transcript_49946:607-1212(+)